MLLLKRTNLKNLKETIMDKLIMVSNLVSKVRAEKVITKTKQDAARDNGRLGSFEIEKTEDGYNVVHVLADKEKELMEMKCHILGHRFHVSGKCIRCHSTEPKKVDMYKQKASEMFNVPYDEVTVEQRTHAKHQMFREAYRVDE